ncbi:MAG TPA: four helix bundle protein [Planctomycetota bacterium]|nr:four helix bundle protein [Planctomycetota bacterium]
MSFMFESLDVYQKAVDFVEQITILTETFPRGYGFLADHLNRASLSIATNLAEGNGRFTKADRRNFFTIARGSAHECVPLLEVARRRSLVDEAQHRALRAELEVMAKMISGLINGIEKRRT